MSYDLKQKGNYNSGIKAIHQPPNVDNVLQNQMDKYINQLQHNKKLFDGKRSKASLVSLRNKWHNQQVRTNYQNEYDRIRGILTNSVLPGVTKDSLDARVKKLQEFGVTDKYDTMPLF